MKEKPSENGQVNMMGVAFELGYIIALPLVGLALAGRFIDNVFASTPIFLLLGMLLAIITSSVLIYRRINGMLVQIDKQNPTNHK